MAVDVSPTVANEFDLPDFSDRFSQSLSRIGRDNLDFQRSIKFRIDKVATRDNASKIILSQTCFFSFKPIPSLTYS